MGFMLGIWAYRVNRGMIYSTTAALISLNVSVNVILKVSVCVQSLSSNRTWDAKIVGSQSLRYPTILNKSSESNLDCIHEAVVELSHVIRDDDTLFFFLRFRRLS